MKKLFSALLIFFVFLIFSSDVFSYPRYSAYTGDKCIDCHVSPTGGLMRNQYGLNYARENLQMGFLEKYTKKVKFNPEINKTIYIGGDVRINNVNDEIPNQPTMTTFLVMQGDLYINALINDYVNIFISPGIQLPGLNTKPEVYGMISKLPLDIYFKAGRFTPNFGIRIAEHRAFQRKDFLLTPYSQDAGFELGLTPGPLTFNIGLFNGINTDFFDYDRKKMFVASADVMFGFKDNNLNFDIGTSFYNNPFDSLNLVTGSNFNALTQAFSGFTKIGIMKHVALLGEVDIRENSSFGNITRAIYGFGELDFKIVNGFEIRGQYEYRDPNRDVGDDRTMRYSIGGVIFPLIGIEFEAVYRFVIDDALPNTHEYQGMLHFYF
jgi:hypothetical protein